MLFNPPVPISALYLCAILSRPHDQRVSLWARVCGSDSDKSLAITMAWLTELGNGDGDGDGDGDVVGEARIDSIGRDAI